MPARGRTRRSPDPENQLHIDPPPPTPRLLANPRTSGGPELTRGRPLGGPSLSPVLVQGEGYPLVGTNAAGEIAFTVIVNVVLTAPSLSGPPGIFTRTTAVPGS